MTIVLNNIRSAWNVGSIFRTADATGCNIILIGYTPRPIGATKKLIAKTAIGAEDTVKYEYFGHFQEVLDAYPEETHLGIEISDQSKPLFNYLQTEDTALSKTEIFLWFGNEIHGLEATLTGQLNAELHLPMVGMKESLNVANTVCAVAYLFLEHLEKAKT
jgi:23S rRNA (guanosine2251-2'-O)-methyltransferase